MNFNFYGKSIILLYSSHLAKFLEGRKKYLNFDGSGLNFSIDIIKDRTSLRFLSHLDKINIKYECISNIMKDSRLQHETIIQQYKDNYFEFKKNIVGI